HRIAILAAPRLLELGHVAQRAVDSPLGRRMWVRADQISQELRPIELAPDLRPTEEESLLGGEAVDHRLRMGGESAFHRRVRNREPAKVADVLAEGELALHV